MSRRRVALRVAGWQQTDRPISAVYMVQRGSLRMLLNVTGFMKIDWARNVTLGLFDFIGLANSYTHTMPMQSDIIRLS